MLWVLLPELIWIFGVIRFIPLPQHMEQIGRSILAERQEGTLARMMASPTSATQVMGGKVAGIFLTGMAQVSVLIIACGLLFQLRWGNPAAVALLIAATAAGATGWGLLIAAISDRPGQVSSYGTALMLIFGILGGSFVQLNLDGPLSWLSKITPNAWAIAGFNSLSAGGTLNDIMPDLLALALMAVVLFIISVTVFRRRSGSLI
jgi:ABC-2 type transport system permease protein